MSKIVANTALAYLREIRNFIKWIFTEKIGIYEEYCKTINYHSQKCLMGFMKNEKPLKELSHQVSCNYNKKYKTQKRSDRFSIEESELFLPFARDSKNSHAECDFTMFKLVYNYGIGISALVNIPDVKHFNGLKINDLKMINGKTYMMIKDRCNTTKPIRLSISDYNMIITYNNKNSINEYVFNCSESYKGKKKVVITKAVVWDRFDKYKKQCENIGIIRKGLKGNTSLLRKAYKDRNGFNADDIERRINE